MPRQLQLTQNLLDRAATVWNVVYGTVSFLINFPSHFEAFVKWIDSLDPSQALASSKIGAYLLNSAARQADGAWKAAKGRALQRKGHTNPVDDDVRRPTGLGHLQVQPERLLLPARPLAWGRNEICAR